MTLLLKRSAVAVIAVGLALGFGRACLAQAPGMPASPLAGGVAAANGQAFIDAHGNPIVMPASYGQPCMGYGEMCPDGCGYGDSAYADFGGYSSPDQCGPHYFDVAVLGVALRPEDLFQDLGPLAAIGQGPAAPRILDLEQEYDDYEVGWQISARYDIGPLSVLEATYMGLYDIGFHNVLRSVELAGGQDNQLTMFPAFGFPPDGGPVLGLDQGSVYNVEYQSDLQSTEFSYRRYWVGYSPRISGTYLAGFRYVRMTEDFIYNTLTVNDNQSNLEWSTANDIVGAQFGGDAWVTLLQGLRLGGETKFGVYNNRFEYRHVAHIPDPRFQPNVDFDEDGNQVAFVGETSLDLVADILPSISLRGGYRVLYLNSLVTVGDQIDPANPLSTELFTQSDALYQGFHAGFEYIW